MLVPDNKHNINDRVYHITPESPKGVVINAKYCLLTNDWEYQVSFSAGADSLWYYEHELSPHIVYG